MVAVAKDWFGDTKNRWRLITTGMVVYALVIGALVYGYARVSSCLASYAERSATATAARADIAAQDRVLDQEEKAAQAKAEAALDLTLCALAGAPDGCKEILAGRPLPSRAEAFAALLRVRIEVRQTRARVAAVRAENERQRLANPPPPPPSQTCGGSAP